tara:strand:+ start:760 stop:1215 length:456 start_codon:yes stop_codon:yes gene_type:complete
MSFSKSFCSRTPFKNVEKPVKSELTEKEKKRLHAVASINYDKVESSGGVDLGTIKSTKKEEKSPVKYGGYVGGGDIAGSYYVPTGQMYADMFAKIGQAVADIDANKQKKKNEKQKKDDAKNLSDNAYFEKYNEQRPKTGLDYTKAFKTNTN